jgi:hypothetical protein
MCCNSAIDQPNWHISPCISDMGSATVAYPTPVTYCCWIIEASLREGSGTHRTAVAVGGKRTHFISSVQSPMTCDPYLWVSKLLRHPTARPPQAEHLLPRNTLAVNTVLISNPLPLQHAPTANWASRRTRGPGRVQWYCFTNWDTRFARSALAAANQLRTHSWRHFQSREILSQAFSRFWMVG